MDGWMEADLINKEKEGTRSFFLPFAFAAYLIADAARNRDLPILALESNQPKQRGKKKKGKQCKGGESH
jgi:hypothetical protein